MINKLTKPMKWAQIKWAQTLMLHTSAACGAKEQSDSRYLCRVGREFDTVAAGVVDIHRIARPIAVHTDILHLHALGFEFLHHDVGIPWALEVEGVVGHAGSGAVLGVEEA